MSCALNTDCSYPSIIVQLLYHLKTALMTWCAIMGFYNVNIIHTNHAGEMLSSDFFFWLCGLGAEFRGASSTIFVPGG